RRGAGRRLSPAMDTTADVLRAAALDLTRTFDLTSVLDKLLEHLAQLVPYDTASVMLLDDDGRLAVRAIRGYERGGDPALTRDHAFDVPNPVFAALVGHRRSILIADTREYPGWPGHAGTEHVRSWMGVALLAAEGVIGLYAVEKAEAGFRSEEHTSELQSRVDLVCRLLLEKNTCAGKRMGLLGLPHWQLWHRLRRRSPLPHLPAPRPLPRRLRTRRPPTAIPYSSSPPARIE